MKLFGLCADYVKMLIKDTIETYSGQWRFIHEAIQNSHDAIQLHDGITQGEITINLHIGTNKVIVIDNGKGIPLKEFSTVFTLGGTAKRDPDMRKILKGSQGVGIKATVFTSDFFEVETNCSDGSWSKRVEGCWDYLNSNFNDDIGEPEVRDLNYSKFYTKVSYSLHDYSVHDFFQEIISEYCSELDVEKISSEKELLDLVELYFRTKTYLGCVQSLLGNNKLKPIRIKVNIILDYPTLEDHRRNKINKCDFISQDLYHGRVISREFPASYMDFKEIYMSLRRSDKADRLFEHLSEVIENPPDRNLKKILIQKLTRDQAKLLLSKIRRDRNTGKLKLIDDPEKTEKQNKLVEKLNGIYLIIGPSKYLKKFLHLSAKQLISINGLPTNIWLNPVTSSGKLGYLLNIHFVMDLNTSLGYGKRNIPSVVKGQADAFFGDIFGLLTRLASLIVGERESIEPPIDVWDKEKAYEEYKAVDNVFKDMDISIKLPPQEEQDVVCLFHELLGCGKLKGYYPFHTSINRTYDALMYVSAREDREMPSEIRWRDLKIVEFKLKLSDLIEDFVNEKKFLRDIDLVVVWEDDYNGDQEYTVSSLERDGIEPLPGASKRIRAGTQYCQLMVLKELLFPNNNNL
ncbi:MAG: ATP-binding protein [Candidatus Hodarchaeales archaeon]